MTIECSLLSIHADAVGSGNEHKERYGLDTEYHGFNSDAARVLRQDLTSVDLVLDDIKGVVEQVSVLEWASESESRTWHEEKVRQRLSRKTSHQCKRRRRGNSVVLKESRALAGLCSIVGLRRQHDDNNVTM